MNRIRILIVEDNDLHFFKLETIVEDLGYELSGRAQSGKEAVRLVKATSPDIILMDVRLAGEEDGISVAERIQDDEIPTIFTTSAKDSDTIQSAIKTNPSGYLIKPIAKEELLVAVELVIQKLNESKTAVIEDEAVFVKSKESMVRLLFEDIVWISNSTQEKYLDIFYNDQVFNVRQSLKGIQDRLPAYFVRISNTHIINSKKITRLQDELMVVEVNGEELKMSRKYKAELKQKLNFL